MAQWTIYKWRISPHLPLAKLLLTLRQVSFSPFELSPAASHPLRLAHASPAVVVLYLAQGHSHSFCINAGSYNLMLALYCLPLQWVVENMRQTVLGKAFVSMAQRRGSDGWFWPRQDRFSLNFITNLHCHFASSLYLSLSLLFHTSSVLAA